MSERTASPPRVLITGTGQSGKMTLFNQLTNGYADRATTPVSAPFVPPKRLAPAPPCSVTRMPTRDDTYTGYEEFSADLAGDGASGAVCAIVCTQATRETVSLTSGILLALLDKTEGPILVLLNCIDQLLIDRANDRSRRGGAFDPAAALRAYLQIDALVPMDYVAKNEVCSNRAQRLSRMFVFPAAISARSSSNPALFIAWARPDLRLRGMLFTHQDVVERFVKPVLEGKPLDAEMFITYDADGRAHYPRCML